MDYDLIVIGAGPAGYVAAIRAGQRGLKTALVEKKKLGGMCLNWGCIPTKALLESARRFHELKEIGRFGIEGVDPAALRFSWKAARQRADGVVRRLTHGIGHLLKKNGIEVVSGEARLEGGGEVSVANRRLRGRHLLIATGSRPAETGLPLPAEMVLPLEEALAADDLPPRLAVAGSGANAVELAQLLAYSGRSVSLLAPGDRLLPAFDPTVEALLGAHLKKDGVEILLNSGVDGVADGGLLAGGRPVAADRVIPCPPRRAVLPPAVMEFATENGFIRVDGQMRTSVEGIWAAGDVNGLSDLAHAASAQGLAVADTIAGVPRLFDPARVPLNLYTSPEVAQLGLTEGQAKASGLEVRVSEFPLAANGKALAEGHSEGIVRLVSETRYGEVLGVQIIAAHATDLIAEAAVLMQLEGTVYDLAATLHAHPTVSEIFFESGMEGVDRAIHK